MRGRFALRKQPWRDGDVRRRFEPRVGEHDASDLASARVSGEIRSVVGVNRSDGHAERATDQPEVDLVDASGVPDLDREPGERHWRFEYQVVERGGCSAAWRGAVQGEMRVPVVHLVGEPFPGDLLAADWATNALEVRAAVDELGLVGEAGLHPSALVEMHDVPHKLGDADRGLMVWLPGGILGHDPQDVVAHAIILSGAAGCPTDTSRLHCMRLSRWHRAGINRHDAESRSLTDDLDGCPLTIASTLWILLAFCSRLLTIAHGAADNGTGGDVGDLGVR